jgi:hypothetical protein
MKSRKLDDKKSKELTPDDSKHAIKQRKLKEQKVKYRHKNTWLEIDEDYSLPNYKDEEE